MREPADTNAVISSTKLMHTLCWAAHNRLQPGSESHSAPAREARLGRQGLIARYF